MNEPPVSASRLTDLLPAPPLVSAAWRTFSVHVVEAPLHATAAFADHALGLCISGKSRIRREMAGRAFAGLSEPGTLNYTPPNMHGTWDASAPFRAIVVLIPDEFVSRVIAEHWEAESRRVEFVPQFLVRDPVVESVMSRLAHEARHGSPSGQLYVESACEFLAHHLIHDYSSLSRPAPRPSGGLPGARLKAVLDFIEENLGRPISLRQLAELAGISARHVERAFRQAVGVSPHSYVLRKRVAAARDLLLREPKMRIEEIASRIGFSSSSHLAAAFRRQTGNTPARFRRLQSR